MGGAAAGVGRQESTQPRSTSVMRHRIQQGSRRCMLLHSAKVLNSESCKEWYWRRLVPGKVQRDFLSKCQRFKQCVQGAWAKTRPYEHGAAYPPFAQRSRGHGVFECGHFHVGSTPVVI